MYKCINVYNGAPYCFDTVQECMLFACSWKHPGDFIGYGAGLDYLKEHAETISRLFDDLDKHKMITVNGCHITADIDLLLPRENNPCTSLFSYTKTPDLDAEKRAAVNNTAAKPAGKTSSVITFNGVDTEIV